MSVSASLRYPIAGGVVAGAPDIIYACTYWALKAGVPVDRILQSVASGLLGERSFESGAPAAALGFLLHFAMAICMSLAYFFAARHFSALYRQPVLSGALYGLGLYGVMNFIVVPLSAAGPGSGDPVWIGLSVLVHVLLVGVPIGLFTHLALREPGSNVR